MLTKAQIQRIAQRNGIAMQVQERDYLQHLLLWLLYSRGQELTFKRRPEEVEVRRELVTSEYDDVRPFVITVLTPGHLMAEKIRA